MIIDEFELQEGQEGVLIFDGDELPEKQRRVTVQVLVSDPTAAENYAILSARQSRGKRLQRKSGIVRVIEKRPR